MGYIRQDGVWVLRKGGGIAPREENDMPRCWKRCDVRLSIGEIDALLNTLNEQFQYADHKGLPISRELHRAYDKLVWRRNEGVRHVNVSTSIPLQNKRTA